MEVPLAAANGDSATAVTTFDLSNGVFARVFPLAPASAAYVGLGVVILGSSVLARRCFSVCGRAPPHSSFCQGQFRDTVA
jgi:hypothetical protein